MKTKMKLISILFITTFFLTTVIRQSKAEIIPPTGLTLKTNGGGIYPDYCLYIANYLKELGIHIEVRVEEWTVFVGTLCITHDFDFGIRTYDFSMLDPDPTTHFSVNGANEYTGLRYDIPYVNQSEELIREALVLSNMTERIERYVEWGNLVMDKIVPVFPLFSERKYVFLWPNVLGYDIIWDLVNCLPYMDFDGYHTNQTSVDELKLGAPNWRELNPLKNDDTVSDFLIDFITEPILQIHPYFQTPLNTGIIDQWIKLNETHYSLHVRDNLFWNPSFNVTERTSDSVPLNSSNVSSLMIGLKGEYSNGTNQQVTAKDVAFTLLAFSNPLISKRSEEYSWIKSIELNPADNLSFNIIIDGNPSTPGLDFYAPLWAKLAIPCLPEFFLNSTSVEQTFSSGNIPMKGLYEDIERTAEWDTYSISGFGCGKYILDYFVRNSKTVFRSNPNWYNIGTIDGSTQFLNISTIIIKVVPDESLEKKLFTEGKLDIFYLDKLFRWDFETYFEIQSSISEDVSCLMFNLKRPFLGGADNYVNSSFLGKEDYSKAATIRKAICYSIDRDEINNNLNEGYYLLQRGLINPIFSNPYWGEIFNYDYNVDSAIEWLTGIRPTTPTPTVTSIPSTSHNQITTISLSFGYVLGTFACSAILVTINRKKRLN